MPLGEALDDDYVVSLLKRDVDANKKRYVTTGLGSLLSGTSNSRARPRAKDAPKPNTRFLRNIIRETDSHNAALKAKEEEESRLRLRELRREERGGKRRREDDGAAGERVGKKVRGGERNGRWASALGGLGKASSRERRGRDASEIKGKGKDSSDLPQPRRRERSREGRGDGDNRHTQASSKRRVTSPEDRRKRRKGSSPISDRSRSPPLQQKSSRRRSPPTHERSKHSSTHRLAEDSDSDPLESIIGPAPPPAIRPRGRGAQKSSAIDSRFASDYDPKTDVSLEHDDHEQDDWDMALEALRDRAKWKAQGADRLKAAGFTDEEVGRWEKGGQVRGEDVEDLRWRKRGEGREWDRGKVLDGEGGVGVRAEWAR